MQRLGLIGGIGPESTIAYYKLIIDIYREITARDAYPSIIINSIDVRRAVALVENDLPGLTDYFVAELQVLADAGATLGLLSANTPHIVFDDIAARSPLPLISIVEATRDAVVASGLTRVGLLGTRFTMQARFYPDVVERTGIALVVPREDEQIRIHDIYMTELLNGRFLPSSREAILRIVSAMRERDAIQAVILAGTELPLLLDDPHAAAVPLLDTTEIHARAAVKRLWGSPA